MSKTLLLGILLGLAANCGAAPVATYDQRQDGDVNFDVDLNNFVILGLLGSGSVSGSASNFDSNLLSQLLDAKNAPTLGSKEQSQEPERNGVQESGVAETRAPEPSSAKAEEGNAAAAGAALLKEADKAARSLGSSNGKETLGKDEIIFKGIKYKLVDSYDEPHKLKLIGGSIEECGPGRRRDRYGVCESDGTE